MRYPHIFRLLVAAGHSGQKAAEIVIDAQRRDRVAQNWIKLLFTNRRKR